MVAINVTGRWTCREVTKPLIKEATNYMLGLLIKSDQELLDDLTVNIELVYNLEKNHNLTGSAWPLENYRSPTKFDIEIDGCCKYKDTLISLGHELVHVKQMALGEWTFNKNFTNYRWLGQTIEHEKLHYHDLPWEIDAHGREFGLYNRYEEHRQGIEPSSDSMIEDHHKLLLANLIPPKPSILRQSRKSSSQNP